MTRIVFLLRNLWYYRTLASTIEALAARGHEVRVATLVGDRVGLDTEGLANAERRLADLAERYPNLGWDRIPYEKERWTVLELVVSRLIDFLYFRRSMFDGKTALRKRVRGPAILQTVLRWRIFGNRAFNRALMRVLRTLELCLPPHAATLGYIRKVRPDVVALSPLVDLGLTQFGQMRATRRCRVPTVLVVNSWDNLSSKSWIRAWPDRITVWNDIQAGEVERFHGIPGDRVTVTGAPNFDDFLARLPTLSREDFCRRVGLDPERPYVLYAASATLERKRSPEDRFVARWLAALRASPDPVLAGLQVMLRPHPKRREIWRAARLPVDGGLTVWPPVAENPVDEQAVADYFHSLHYAAAVVGINTSAFLESAVLGRPAFTVLDRDFAHSQTETFHFDYLVRDGRGLLRTAPSIEAHLAGLAECLRECGGQTAAEAGYARAFVRPPGQQVPASEALADAVAGMAGRPVGRDRPGEVWRLVVRYAMLMPLSWLTWTQRARVK